MDEEFLLHSDTAGQLYHGYAEPMPIVDFHCHVPPQDIAENRRFENITQVLLGGGHYGDHYVWRLLRTCGVPEREITGDAGDRVRFQHLAEVMPRCVGNPVYQWLHLELKRYFGYDGVLNDSTAQDVWELCNRQLQTGEMPVHDILRRSRVETVATTDDPADDLRYHAQIMKEGVCPARVLPAFRPDKAVNIQKPEFAAYVRTLAGAANVTIAGLDDLKDALSRRMDFFGAMGCHITDHGLDMIPCAPADESVSDAIFRRAMKGESLTARETEIYQTAVLRFLGREYARRGWVMQLHYGARRNVNSRQYARMGPDTGYDCISDRSVGASLCGLLDDLEQADSLPKTVLYSLNPNDNTMLTSTMGCFQGAGISGKVQHGCAWWFNDTKAGMTAQLTNLASGGVLGSFIGMLTDSRSFLSYVRHEYFRRLLCDILGTWVEDGEYPADMKTLGALVEDISYYNAKRYFEL